MLTFNMTYNSMWFFSYRYNPLSAYHPGTYMRFPGTLTDHKSDLICHTLNANSCLIWNSELTVIYLHFFKFKWKQAVFRMMLPKYMALTMCLNITPNDIFKRLSSWNKALAMVRLLLLGPQSKAEWQRFLTATFKTDAKYSQELYGSSDPLTQ